MLCKSNDAYYFILNEMKAKTTEIIHNMCISFVIVPRKCDCCCCHFVVCNERERFRLITVIERICDVSSAFVVEFCVACVSVSIVICYGKKAFIADLLLFHCYNKSDIWMNRSTKIVHHAHSSSDDCSRPFNQYNCICLDLISIQWQRWVIQVFALRAPVSLAVSHQ